MHNDLNFFEEQDALKEYCNNHPLNRPPQNWMSLIKYILLWCSCYIFLCILFNIIKDDLFPSYGKVLLNIIITLSVILLSAKSFLVTAVQVYQHYAPEHIRRKCICKPSCSEYALLALRKYNLFVAVRMIYIRLNETCRGPLYIEDYP